MFSLFAGLDVQHSQSRLKISSKLISSKGNGSFRSLIEAGGVVLGVCLGCSWGPLRSCNLLCFSSSASSLAVSPSPEIECLLLCFCLTNASCAMDSLNGHITLSFPFLVSCIWAPAAGMPSLARSQLSFTQIQTCGDPVFSFQSCFQLNHIWFPGLRHVPQPWPHCTLTSFRRTDKA